MQLFADREYSRLRGGIDTTTTLARAVHCGGRHPLVLDRSLSLSKKAWHIVIMEACVAAFICDAVRTPIGRYGGALSSIRPDDLAAHVIRALLTRTPQFDPAVIDDVFFGCANQSGEDNRNVARMAVLLAGLPESVPGVTVNRLCASGLEAVVMAARSIAVGAAEVIIAGGVESMSRAPFVMPKAERPFSRAAKLEDSTLGWRFINPLMRERYGVDSMPETAEHVARSFNVSRADQDAFALRSQQRWSRASASGFFKREIVSVSMPAGRSGTTMVEIDEAPRPDTTLEALAKLTPVTNASGTVTAGNSSPINDGASALLIATEAAARRYGLTVRARIVAATAAGVSPRIMGIGPVPATQKLLARTKLTLGQIEVVELNEAFASQSLAVLRELGLPDDAPHVNANGGAIAIGHPLGASGARLATTVVNRLECERTRYGLATMCVGVGQGVSVLFERT
jgi:3-oxoadipyl-CoA thiolase